MSIQTPDKSHNKSPPSLVIICQAEEKKEAPPEKQHWGQLEGLKIHLDHPLSEPRTHQKSHDEKEEKTLRVMESLLNQSVPEQMTVSILLPF